MLRITKSPHGETLGTKFHFVEYDMHLKARRKGINTSYSGNYENGIESKWVHKFVNLGATEIENELAEENSA